VSRAGLRTQASNWGGFGSFGTAHSIKLEKQEEEK
jgi:hypothetical protein